MQKYFRGSARICVYIIIYIPRRDIVYMKKCIIVGAGDFYGIHDSIEEYDFVIAADGGFEHLLHFGVVPDLLIGDMDSIKNKDWSSLIQPEKTTCIQLPTEKDDTDMLAAIKEGLKRGCTEFAIYGALGGRIDHSLANIQCLCYLCEQHARGIIYGEHDSLELLCNERRIYPATCKGMISVFAFGGTAKGVTEEGLKYGLQDAEVTVGKPIGVSNEFIGQESMIEVKDGMLLVYLHEACVSYNR